MGTKYIIPGSTTYPGTSAYPILTRIDDDGEYTVPANAVEVDDAIFQRSIAEPDAWLFDPATGGLVAKPAPTDAEQLPGAKQTKIAELAAACRAQIVSGFDSAALGTVHHYPAGQQDQANLTASVTASLVPNLPAGWTTPFWCADSAGVWAYVEHTASQIQQVGLDGKAAITAALQRNAQLRAQVEAATSLAEVATVLW